MPKKVSKKKKTNIGKKTDAVKATERKESRMRPTEWAIQKDCDPALYLHWETQLMTEQEFEELRKERGE